MYYIIKIKTKKYIFFPFSLRFFRYTEELEKEINSKQHYEIQKILKEERDIQEKYSWLYKLIIKVSTK